MIIAVTGFPGAGKSTVAELICERADDSVELETGQVTRKAFFENKGRKPESSDELGDWVTSKMEDDNLYFSKKMSEYIEDMDSEIIILGGLRRKDELDDIRDTVEENFIIITVEADEKTRLERLRERDRDNEGEFSLEDLRKRDEREIGWGVDEMIEASEIKIRNEDSLDELKNKVDEMMESL